MREDEGGQWPESDCSTEATHREPFATKMAAKMLPLAEAILAAVLAAILAVALLHSRALRLQEHRRDQSQRDCGETPQPPQPRSTSFR